MKKFFLIPLMTLMCSVMAFATVRTAGSYAELNSALSAAQDGDEIQLTADITYSTGSTVAFSVGKNVTIDGQGHTISGSGKSVFLVQGTNAKHVTAAVFKNLNVTNTTGRVFQLYDYLDRVDIENCEIISQGASAIGGSNPEAITLWSDTDPIELYLTNAQVSAGSSGYPVIMHNQTTLNAANSTFSGYCSLYFKEGSKHSVVTADACNFDAPNVHNGKTNAFAVFAIEDADMTFALNNCGMNAQSIGDQSQDIFCLSEWTKNANRGVGSINITLSGDNTHFNTSSTVLRNNYIWPNPSGTPQYGANDDNYIASAESAIHVDVTFTISGGTYSVNPENMIFKNDRYYADDEWHATEEHFTIATGYEVQEINQGGVTLYRVVKKAQEKEPGVMYDLNDFVPVEGEGYGDNPVSSFDLSTGTDMTLNQETTTAGYVQVSDKDNGVDPSTPTTVTVGTPSQDQTLVINNGLDVQGDSKVVVEAGSTLQIGEGGINTEKPENIVINADENGAASLLLDPTISVNQTPNLTVEMKVSQAGKDAYGDYWWHRFAMPVGHLPEAWTKSPNYGTYLYGWNYATNDWEQVAGGSTNMQPWKGYTLTYNEAYNENETVTYTFKGNLVGNQDAALTFEEEGYQFFGNSYTGYMDVLTLINNLTDGNIDQTVWMWNPANQTYSAVPLDKLSDPAKAARLKDWQKEVAPMQTFIMRLRGASSANETVSYADAIWGNPRYGNSAAPAPRRLAVSADEAYMEIVVTAANGQSDRVDFTVNSEYSDAFENGIDASKYMNERHINLYATVAGEDYTSVATDNIEGKTISLQTKNDINYTISFENVETADYALLDKLTNSTVVIAEGNTYEFAAQPNSLVENRFEIVALAKMPTAIENTNVKAGAKGIYTIMGQYLGENFDILPAGVYVINGVKIVK